MSAVIRFTDCMHLVYFSIFKENYFWSNFFYHLQATKLSKLFLFACKNTCNRERVLNGVFGHWLPVFCYLASPSFHRRLSGVKTIRSLLDF